MSRSRSAVANTTLSAPGSSVAITLTATNRGIGAVPRWSLAHTEPSALTLVSRPDGALPALQPQASHTATFVFRLGASENQQIVSFTALAAPEYGTDMTPVNNTVQVAITIATTSPDSAVTMPTESARRA
ncbi:uncharacterized protein AMSG_08523 [Thecamonas trahens ATCC 50062]|uniref:DUF11 domain-containing protein n=1 Tax=Thecamonas trahens ATCC 50062 TaxID=461836 RepID=A0A0L0DJS1_THETB|nr:hypothetical protein AMSG_08523 [Thecamonas trahens ATCC 50062]KNC52654.1 hypothetical protein AMSG_08523 [Thecamonas trahens ATCC 50062]|eukprot:XP_013755205.1 hypothetical protein AMSG_08523 [Thecamonas trahens ATCC 50062]